MQFVVPLAPPEPTLVESIVPAASTLEADQLASLYEAAAVDVLRTAAASGGDVLVNYREAETLSAEIEDPVERVRDLVDRAIDEYRFEPQVGSSRSARIGNTVTHLLEQESAEGVAVIEPTAPLLERTHLDRAAMALRRSDVVIGPALAGRVSHVAFAAPIDFTDVYAESPCPEIAERAAAAGHGVTVAALQPTLRSRAGLETLAAVVRTRENAGLSVPGETAAVLEALEW